MSLEAVLTELRDFTARTPFADVPDVENVLYAVWVDVEGARELTQVSPEPIAGGIVYVGECVTQSARRHLAHNQIGSLTLMKNLAALFRVAWSIEAERNGAKLREPGLTRLREWMATHLSATVAARAADITTRSVLTALDPPLRIEGWSPERTELRRHLTEERAQLDRHT